MKIKGTVKYIYIATHTRAMSSLQFEDGEVVEANDDVIFGDANSKLGTIQILIDDKTMLLALAERLCDNHKKGFTTKLNVRAEVSIKDKSVDFYLLEIC